MRNGCRHGFKGDIPKGENQKCNFIHPKICRPYINFGTNGCNKGGNCKFVHPTLCKSSEDTKTCPNMINGRKCRRGYHLRDTVPATQTPPPTQIPNPSEKIVNEGQNTKDFLSQMIRQEINKAMMDLIPKTPPVQSQEPTPMVQKQQTGQDYLWALLGRRLLSSA